MATTESPRARFRAFRKSLTRITPARYQKDNAVTLCREKHVDTSSSNSEDGVLAGALSTSIILPKEQLSVLTPIVGPTLNLQISKIAVAPPNQGEVVVQIAWTGLCGSDPSFCIGPQQGFPSHNHIAGHEGIGHIVASHDPALLNKPVATRYLTYSCQSCEYCLRGLPESCPKQLAFPKDLNGTFQQYITVPGHSVIQLPEYVFAKDSAIHPSAYAAALCSGSAALKALRAARPRAHGVIAVFGIAGSIGHLVGFMAKNIYGAKVIGVDVEEKSRDRIFEQGDICDRFVALPEDSEQGTFQGNILKHCESLRGQKTVLQGADSLIVCANRMSGFKDLTRYVCDGGFIIIVGVPSDGNVVSFPISQVLTRQIRIEGSLMGGQREMLQCLDWIRIGMVKPYVTEIAFDDIPRYMNRFKTLENTGKIVARISGMPVC